MCLFKSLKMLYIYISISDMIDKYEGGGGGSITPG